MKKESLYFKLDDPGRLRMIAHWLQLRSEDNCMEIEDDLRRIAKDLEYKAGLIIILKQQIKAESQRSFCDRITESFIFLFRRRQR